MKVQCIDAQSAEAIAFHATQYQLQDYGVSISAEGNALSVVPTNALVRLISNVIGKVFDLFLCRPECEVSQQRVSGDIVTS